MAQHFRRGRTQRQEFMPRRCCLDPRPPFQSARVVHAWRPCRSAPPRDRQFPDGSAGRRGHRV